MTTPVLRDPSHQVALEATGLTRDVREVVTDVEAAAGLFPGAGDDDDDDEHEHHLSFGFVGAPPPPPPPMTTTSRDVQVGVTSILEQATMQGVAQSMAGLSLMPLQEPDSPPAIERSVRPGMGRSTAMRQPRVALTIYMSRDTIPTLCPECSMNAAAATTTTTPTSSPPSQPLRYVAGVRPPAGFRSPQSGSPPPYRPFSVSPLRGMRVPPRSDPLSGTSPLRGPRTSALGSFQTSTHGLAEVLGMNKQQ